MEALKDIGIYLGLDGDFGRKDSTRPYSVAVTGQTVTPIRNIFKIGLDKVGVFKGIGKLCNRDILASYLL